jgi:hypothetical protein
MARLKFGWQLNATLTYGAYEADGTEITAAGASLPESVTAPGYYTVIDASVAVDDVIVVKEGTDVVGFGEAVSYAGEGTITVVSADYIGDFVLNDTISFAFNTTIDIIDPGTLKVYKTNDDSGPIIPSGAVLDEDFNSEVGVYQITIPLLAPKYEREEDYFVLLSGATIGGETVTAIVGTFSIENRWHTKHRWISR